jgi:hypothetical protein
VVAAEQDLGKLLDDCKKLAQDLIDCLNKVIAQDKEGESQSGKDKKPRGRWKNLGVAIGAVWREGKIHDLTTRLETHRQQLMLRMLVLSNAR